MNNKGAETLIVQALQFIAADQELTDAFLAMSGLRAQDLRQAAADPGFGVSLLDFLLEDDERVLRFARLAGIAPQEVMSARTVLAGPGSFGWAVD